MTIRFLLGISIGFLFSLAVSAQQTAADYRVLADQKVEENDIQYAAILLDHALNIDSLDYELWIYRGRLESTFVNDLSPVTYYQRALLLDTTNATVYNEIGLFLSHRGHVQESLQHFEKAISHAKTDSAQVAYLTNRGVAYKNINDHVTAIVEFNKALQIDSTDQGALNNLAVSYGETGQLDKSLALLKQLYIVAEDEEMKFASIINVGMSYTEMNQPDSALVWFNKGFAIYPEQPLLLSNRADALRQLKRYPEALESINASIALYPENSWAYLNLAKIYFDQGLNDEGCRALEFSKGYGFRESYGDRVDDLFQKKCD